MNPNFRQVIEQAIVRKVVATLLADEDNYTISVHDGDGVTLRRSRDINAIVGAMMTTDEEMLLVYPHNGNDRRTIIFIYGNNGFDVINDYSTSLESIMEPISKWVDELEQGQHISFD